MTTEQKVFQGNNLELLKNYPDNYFDAIVTDPPYGLGKEPDAHEMLQAWITDGYLEVKGAGFMGKEWDAFVPQPIFWKEVFRVLKHGGHVLAFYGTRTYDWGVMAMRLAGFEVRDCIQWVYGSGFPKSLSVSKSIDNRNKDKWNKISKSFDNIDKKSIFELWKKELRVVNSADVILKKNQTEIGTHIQKKDFVQDCVVLKIREKDKKLNAIIAELNLKELNLIAEENQFIVQENVEANIEPLPNHVKYVLKSLQDLNHLLTSIFTVELDVKELQKEKISQIIKAEEVLMTCYGNQKFLKEEDIFVLCVELIKDLKHIILNQSRIFQNLDTIYQMDCACAINVIITEYMAENLISNMVDILKNEAIDKMYGAEREVVGKQNYTMPKADNTMGENSYGISGGKLANGTTAERIVGDITAPATEKAKEWEGWGSAIKPAVEPIVLARKPLEKGLSIAENVLKWGTGAINIDGCRVGSEKLSYVSTYDRMIDKNVDSGYRPETTRGTGKEIEQNVIGRFPANIILSHHPDCECKGLKKIKPSNGSGKASEKGGGFGKGMFGDGNSDNIGGGFTDENGQETVEHWECHENCPIKIMDEQSGELNKQGVCKTDNKSGWQNNYVGGNGVNAVKRKLYLDTGGASRFFYIAKASKSERNRGLNGFETKQTKGGGGGIGDYLEDVNSASGKYGSEKAPSRNHHPTIKPVKLCQYLVRLITPPNGIVLDPFCGSGTTGIACKLENFSFVGMELDAEYAKIAEARIANYTEEPEPELEFIEEEQQPKRQLNLF